METGKRVGSYVVEGPVGRGGMGVVYRGRHEKLPRVVAIKSINPRGTHDLRRLRHRFEREAYVQAQLDHPGIVKIYDYIVSEQTYFIVMEYVEGSSLAQLIAEHPAGLPQERALDLFEQILDAVSYAHTFVYRDEGGQTRQGIVHRDLKPPNIMVTPGDRIKITDFGIVKLVGAEQTDTSKIAYGSPRYVSPEQAAGDPLDQRSDIYSLGVILYEMLTGEPPFGGRPEEKGASARPRARAGRGLLGGAGRDRGARREGDGRHRREDRRAAARPLPHAAHRHRSLPRMRRGSGARRQRVPPLRPRPHFVARDLCISEKGGD